MSVNLSSTNRQPSVNLRVWRRQRTVNEPSTYRQPVVYCTLAQSRKVDGLIDVGIRQSTNQPTSGPGGRFCALCPHTLRVVCAVALARAAGRITDTARAVGAAGTAPSGSPARQPDLTQARATPHTWDSTPLPPQSPPSEPPTGSPGIVSEGVGWVHIQRTGAGPREKVAGFLRFGMSSVERPARRAPLGKSLTRLP